MEKDALVQFWEYIKSDEFLNSLENKTPEEIELIQKKIKIMGNLTKDYLDALQQSIIEDKKKEWSKP